MSVLSKTIGSPSIEMIFVGLIKAVLILLEPLTAPAAEVKYFY
jgi:hypothetical protein